MTFCVNVVEQSIKAAFVSRDRISHLTIIGTANMVGRWQITNYIDSLLNQLLFPEKQCVYENQHLQITSVLSSEPIILRNQLNYFYPILKQILFTLSLKNSLCPNCTCLLWKRLCVTSQIFFNNSMLKNICFKSIYLHNCFLHTRIPLLEKYIQLNQLIFSFHKKYWT